MPGRYGAGDSPRVDPNFAVEYQYAVPLRTIGPIQSITTPLSDVVAAPFSIGGDTGCSNAALRVTGGIHTTTVLGVGLCPPNATPGNAWINNQLVVGTDPGGSETARIGGSLRVSTVGSTQIKISGAAGGDRDLQWHSAGVERWIFRVDTSAESGSNVGSNIGLQARTDAGAFLRTAIAITRSNGFMAINTGSVGLEYTGSSISPSASGGATLGTSTLPWGALALRTTGADETVRIQAFGATSGPYLAFFNSAGTRNGFIQFDYNAGGSIYIANESTTGLIGFYTNGSQRWRILSSAAGSHFEPIADNTYDIGTTSQRVATVNVRRIQLFDDITNGNPHISWSWKNGSGTARTGYLEATGDTVRFYSTTASNPVLTMNYSTRLVTIALDANRFSINDGSSNTAGVGGVVVSTSSASGDYPEGTIWCKV